jgi:hypothetical protein
MPNDRNNVIAYFKFYPLCLLPGGFEKENLLLSPLILQTFDVPCICSEQSLGMLEPSNQVKR